MASYAFSECSFSDDDAEEDGGTFTKEDLLKLNPFRLANFSKSKIKYMALFDVEHWALALKAATFATAVAEVTRAEAIAVKHYFQEVVVKHSAKITPEDDEALTGLERKLEALMIQLTREHGSGSFFIRMGPRSPKDAPIMVVRAPVDMLPSRAARVGISEAILKGRLREAGDLMHGSEDEKGRTHPCDILGRFQSVAGELLRVTSAIEAIRLLTASSRVMQDVCHTLDITAEGASDWSMSIVAREWDDKVKLEREFRTFVVAGEITAISQYDDQLMYPFVASSVLEIVASIKRCCAASALVLTELFGSNGVVVDVAVIPSTDGEPWQARVIELNPFGPMTGASLFHWTSDRRLLQGGLNLYGDLEQCEAETPPGSVRLPDHVREEVVMEVPFRFLAKHPAHFTWDHLEAYWNDYVRLAPPALISIRSCKSKQTNRDNTT